jgi:hypothetical protein
LTGCFWISGSSGLTGSEVEVQVSSGVDGGNAGKMIHLTIKASEFEVDIQRLHQYHLRLMKT